MSPTSSTHGHVVPWRRLITLIVLIVALVGALLIGSLAGDKHRWVPDFALDLEGGTQLILTPTTTDGSEITQNDVNQAIEIIRQRVDASGVAEAEIQSQGGKNIVVGLPGTPSQETLNLVRTSAVLRMRAVLQQSSIGTALTPAIVQQLEQAQASAAPTDGSTGAATATPSASATTSASPSASATPSASASPTIPATEKYTPEELQTQAKKIADLDGDGKISDTPTTTPTDASDTAWITEEVYYQSLILDCTDPKQQNPEADDPAKPFVACDPDTGAKYILGPAEVEGTSITKASSGYDQQKAQWVVNLEFNKEGGKAFGDVTTRIYKLDSPRNLFAIVLDGKVISAAVPNGPITNGQAQISGKFNSQQVTTLANQLNFGSLPLNFEVQSEEQVSATLGSESLSSGLIAGLIGLILVILYLLWQYHGLGIVAAGSVVIATGISYLLVCLLSWGIGYRLSLAGVVGLIISIGITADSFIVFFERIRDEIREGRTLKAAVSHGWDRAKRTIIVADGVNLLASVVLYFLAVGSVRGFAFTLGLTTVIDLVIVMMFTYPVMTLLVRTKFFGEGHRFSGMDPEALGRTPAYRGRSELVSRSKKSAKTTLAEEIASAVTEGVENREDGKSPVTANVAVKERDDVVESLDSPELSATDSDLAPRSDENGTLSLAERRAQARRAAKATATDGEASEREENL